VDLFTILCLVYLLIGFAVALNEYEPHADLRVDLLVIVAFFLFVMFFWLPAIVLDPDDY
jgi:hypothetical protein